MGTKKNTLWNLKNKIKQRIENKNLTVKNATL